MVYVKFEELLYNMKHEDDTLVINTGEWHFDRDVYNKSQI